jgi:hypothetical protein
MVMCCVKLLWKCEFKHSQQLHTTQKEELPITIGHIGAEISTSPKIELMDGSTEVSSIILKTPEGDQCWCAYII